MNKLTIATVAVLALAATPAPAAEQPAPTLQISTFVGALVPTGAQRDVLKDAALVGVAASFDFTRYVAIVGTFGWAPSHGRGGSFQDQHLDVFQYDLGIQAQYPLPLTTKLTLRPVAGAGLGGRTYDYRDVDIEAENDVAGYLSLGAWLEHRDIAVGLTVRDYLSDFDGFGVVERGESPRNEVAVFASVGKRF